MMALLFAAALSAFAPVTRETAAQGEALSATGVVTMVAYWQTNSFVCAACDDPNGTALYVAGQHPKKKTTPVVGGPLSVGDVVAFTGCREAMLFSPGVHATRLEKLGSEALPEPPLYRLADFAGGRLDNRRVRLRGIVQEVDPISAQSCSVRLFSEGDHFEMRVPGSAADWRSLVDAEVEATGVAMSRFNPRAEFLGVRLEAPSRDAVKVVLPPRDLRRARAVAPEKILSWRPGGVDGHRVKVGGVVTAVEGSWAFYLELAGHGLRLALADNTSAPKLGERVFAYGFPEIVDGIGELKGATWERDPNPVGVPPEPKENFLALMEKYSGLATGLSYPDINFSLVKVVGRLSCEADSGFVLTVGTHHFRVVADAGLPEAVARVLTFNPQVSVTGVLRLKMSNSAAEGRRPDVVGGDILTRLPADFALIPDRALYLAKGRSYLGYLLGAIVLAALIVIAYLGALLLKRRREAREAALLAADRKRMAGDLHDTIEQHLAGAKILLSTALKVPDGMKGEAECAVTIAAEVLAEAKRQIRDVILNLRNEELMKKPVDELLKSVADSVNRSGATRVRVLLREVPESLPAGAKTDLIAIVQQAITNAVKHGHAKNVVIAGDPGLLRVANDGAPFDAAAALGPEAGHFGLSSMRERAKRSGFGFSIAVDGRWTIVFLRLGSAVAP